MNREHAARVLQHLERRERLTVTIEWISVRERFPPSNTEVILGYDDGSSGTGHTDGKRWYDADGQTSGVTYWAYFPLSPGAA